MILIRKSPRHVRGDLLFARSACRASRGTKRSEFFSKKWLRLFFDGLKKEGRSFQLRPSFLNIFYCAVRTVRSERSSMLTTGGATKLITSAVARPAITRVITPPKT